MGKTKSKKPKVTIVILNWNGIADTLECLSSLSKVNYPNFRIIVVDNGSADPAEAVRIKQKFPDIQLFRSSKNLGFAGGNNLGIKTALKQKSDFVLLLNNDTVARSDFLTKMVKFMQSNPDVGASSPLIYIYKNPKKLWFSYGYLYLFLGNIKRSTDEKDFDKNKIWFISGCCMLVKSKVFQKIGSFDNRFFAYFEDTDLCVRIKRAGFNIGVVEGAKIYHKVSKSTGGVLGPPYLYYMTRNNWLFACKNLFWYHWATFLAFYLYYRFLLQGTKIVLKSKTKRLLSFKAIFKGAFDAWRGKYGEANFR